MTIRHNSAAGTNALPPSRSTASTGDRMHAAALGVAVGINVGYWVGFFTGESVRTTDDPAWLDFEKALVLADGYMDVVGLAAAVQLWRGRPSAVALGIAAGSAVTFLGLMDVLYNLQHGKYADRSSAMALEAAVNVISLTLGPFTMVRLWQARHRLGA